MYTYWELQTKLILELNDIGLNYKLRDRLPVFKLYVRLMKLASKKPKLAHQIENILDLLEYLLAARRAGLEPELETPTRYKISE